MSKCMKFPRGAYTPSVFAAVIAKGAKIRRPCGTVVDAMMNTQRRMGVRCHTCGRMTSPVMIWKRWEIARLYDIAMRMKYGDFLLEVDRQYRRFTAVCPNCGTQGKLPLLTGGRDRRSGGKGQEITEQGSQREEEGRSRGLGHACLFSRSIVGPCRHPFRQD